MIGYFFTGLIGSIIGVCASFGIVLLKEHIEAQACIKAIRTELKSLYNICKEIFDKEITDDEKPLMLSYPLDTDYFTIFNNNSCKIGKFPDDYERELIVTIYNQAKFFLDCLRTNNRAIEYFEDVQNGKYNNEYELHYENALNNLRYSKNNNILPAYKKLIGLLEQLILP